MAHYLSQSRIEDTIWLEPIDISFLQTRISDAETVARGIEIRIEELRAQISELARQKDAKFAEIGSLRNVLAPVRRVPLEILSEIFELTRLLDDEDDYTNDLVRSMFTLSGVCAAWRKAAHATPRLWCRLNISLRNFHLDSDFGWVDGWVTRSQGLPLDLYFDYFEEPDKPKNLMLWERGKEFQEYVLANFSNKIRVLCVYGRSSSFLPILQLPPSLPLLEHVSLRGERDVSAIERVIELPSRVFLGSPKLREFELNSASLLKFVVLPAEQLTLLKLHFNSELAVCWDVLSRCKSLVSLEIDRYSPAFGDHSGIVALPTLKSFRVGHCAATRDFLRCLTAPLLEDLFIEYQNKDNFNAIVDGLTTFQQRSATKLSSLTFRHGISISNSSKHVIEKMVAIFSLFPTIQSLKIYTVFDVESIFQAMTCTEGYRVLPNLKHLTLHCYSQRYLDASELKSMVLSRWWPDRFEVGGGLVSDRNGLCRLQKVTIRGFHVRGLVEDITDLSALSGFILDYRPVERQLQA